LRNSHLCRELAGVGSRAWVTTRRKEDQGCVCRSTPTSHRHPYRPCPARSHRTLREYPDPSECCWENCVSAVPVACDAARHSSLPSSFISRSPFTLTGTLGRPSIMPWLIFLSRGMTVMGYFANNLTGERVGWGISRRAWVCRQPRGIVSFFQIARRKGEGLNHSIGFVGSDSPAIDLDKSNGYRCSDLNPEKDVA